MNRVAALLLIVLLTGCASVEHAQPPTIQLSNLRLGTPGLLSQELLLEIRIGNPNDFALPVNGLTFQLDVNGQRFADGLSNDSVTVPRLGYATMSVTGSADTLAIVRQVLSLGNRERMTYRLHGTAYVGHLGRNTPLSYDRKGELSLLPDSRKDQQGGPRTLVPIIGLTGVAASAHGVIVIDG